MDILSVTCFFFLLLLVQPLLHVSYTLLLFSLNLRGGGILIVSWASAVAAPRDGISVTSTPKTTRMATMALFILFNQTYTYIHACMHRMTLSLKMTTTVSDLLQKICCNNAISMHAESLNLYAQLYNYALLLHHCTVRIIVIICITHKS